MSQINLQQVSKTYANGFTALRPLDLKIEAGSFTAILGPSGAGKSTLLRTINGLVWSTTGSVCIGDQPLTRRNLRSVRSHIGMVFQDFSLVERLNVATNVLCGRLSKRSAFLSLLHMFRPEDLDIARTVLTRVGLAQKAWERCDKLSGGQKQRVGIARALAQQPQIILADEPVASLDPRNSLEIMDLLQTICREEGLTVVANLHQVDLARTYADRIIGLNQGHKVFDGTAAELDDIQLQRIYQNDKPIQQPPLVAAALAYT